LIDLHTWTTPNGHKIIGSLSSTSTVSPEVSVGNAMNAAFSRLARSTKAERVGDAGVGLRGNIDAPVKQPGLCRC
jgi:hypothetical protein